MDIRRIRNFSIIAHIDHGKSTLADRILEITGAINKREMVSQFLDKMDIERERGITIKAQSVRLLYTAKNGHEYILNLIDTPGHVDFTYEVSRSLAACEGAILVVDAAQGVEAQTISHVYMACDLNLEIIPVLNKIDLITADPEKVKREVEDIIGLDASFSVMISAKEGTGIHDLLETIIERIPSPQGSIEKPLSTLLFDSWFDSYQGVVMLVRVFDGVVSKGMKIRISSTGKEFEVARIGVFSPDMIDKDELYPGEVGYIIAGIKDIRDTKVGDTITSAKTPVSVPLSGFKEIKPVVFAGLYPIASVQYDQLRNALEKLSLNDSSFQFEPETSSALGFGFRCGFLGLLHMEIIQERLEREYRLNLITSVPTVVYKAFLRNGTMLAIDNPKNLPESHFLDHIEELFVKVSVYTPTEFVGAVLKLCEEKRGEQKELQYLNPKRVLIEYDMPFSEIIFDFFDKLKSSTRGYATMDYTIADYGYADMVRVDILINGDPVDALSLIVHKSKAYYKGKELVTKMKELIPRQLYEVVIQAAIGKKVIAREGIRPLRKNVTAKCYGGDITRKRKLLERQKEGKKRLKQIGDIEIPQEAFLAILKM
ncbi:MAG: translation elongation factor 4 [Thermodesulfobacteriota bacterium]|nr:translation elongation factor 4 [Thermodesulfobacteriota bacterium]